MKRTFTHLNRKGETAMVDVTPKAVTLRRAVAEGTVVLTAPIARAIRSNSVAKGNVLEVARIGAIQAAKRTPEWIPLCHTIPLSKVSVDFKLTGARLRIRAEAVAEAKTGVEMEALTAVASAALIVYDMCKGIDKGMVIEEILLLEKEGGKSGRFTTKARRTRSSRR